MTYKDRSIGVTETALTIRGYYWPGFFKRIPLDTIHSVRRTNMASIRGKGRIWGTANPGYWANLDFRRPGKSVAFLVNVGKTVKPFITPDDPDAFESALRDRGVEVTDGGSAPIM